MGHSYGRTASGRMALACDHCGTVGGVRARTCKYKVLTDNHRSANGNRHRIAYCYPPDLCADCYRALGGMKGIHGDTCREGAAKSQAEYDIKQAKLDAGELLVASAITDRDDPAYALVTFTNAKREFVARITSDDYQPTAKPSMNDYPSAVQQFGEASAARMRAYMDQPSDPAAMFARNH